MIFRKEWDADPQGHYMSPQAWAQTLTQFLFPRDKPPSTWTPVLSQVWFCIFTATSAIVSFWIINLYFLKYKFIYFNWRLITLQYYIGFAIRQHESSMGVHVFPILNPLPPPSPSHPSGSSQCTSPEHPVSCIEPGLVIHFLYDIIHVSMPFSQIIPPSPSTTETDIMIYVNYTSIKIKLK